MATNEAGAVDAAPLAERVAELREHFRWHDAAGIALDTRSGRLFNRRALRLVVGADAAEEWTCRPGPVVLRGSGAWWRAAWRAQRRGCAVAIPPSLRAPEPDPYGWWP